MDKNPPEVYGVRYIPVNESGVEGGLSQTQLRQSPQLALSHPFQD